MKQIILKLVGLTLVFWIISAKSSVKKSKVNSKKSHEKSKKASSKENAKSKHIESLAFGYASNDYILQNAAVNLLF